jgi:hypothetical protein
MKGFLLLAGLAAAPVLAQAGDRPFLVRESGRSYARLQDAVEAIGPGSGTIVIAPGRYRECAVQEAGRIAFVAAEPGMAILDGAACEDKAALVLRGRGASVEGLVFQNIRVSDENGAGIRLTQGDLFVRDSVFRDSESGILAGNDEHASILIERSTFSRLGLCASDCAHSVYVGGYGSLTIRRSRFERGTGGHYVKSRAARIEITDSSFDDTAGAATNYMIDLSNGATGTIARNLFVQGRDKENYSAFITVAPEGVANSSEGLSVFANQAGFAPGVARSSAFVADWSGERLSIGENRLAQGLARLQRRN